MIKNLYFSSNSSRNGLLNIGLYGLAALLLLSVAACTSGKGTGLIRTEKNGFTETYEPSEKANIFYFLQAERYRKEGDFKQALEEINKAIDQDPDSVFLQIELAKLLVYTNDMPQAVAVIQKGLEQAPDNTDFLSILAQVKLMQNKNEEVTSLFERILSIDPNDQAVYFLLGGLYSKMNQTDKAVDTFKRLTDVFPESFSGHYYLGKLYVVEGEYPNAEKELRKAYDLNSDLVEALYGLIQIYEIQNKPAAIPGLYALILKGNPEDVRASLALALIYHTTNKEDQAAILLKSLGAQSDEDPDVLRLIVRQYIKKGKCSEAIYLIDGIVKNTTQKGDFFYFLGLCHEETNDHAAAIRAFEKVPSDSTYYEKSVLISAFNYMDMKQNDKAITTLENALEITPKNKEFLFYLGSFYEEQEQFQKAMAMYKKGLALDEGNSKLYFRLGVLYDKEGDRIACIEKMKKVIELDPEDANALNYLGYTYADLGMNLEEAEQLIKRALTFKPDDGYITDSLGWVHYKKGEYKQAVALLEKAVQLIPNDPILLEHLGDALSKTSEHDKALEFYMRSLKNKKKDLEELKLKIEQLMNHQTSLNP